MVEAITLAAEDRDEFGKGAARRLRRAGRVPAVLYGHGTDPVHLSLPGHETLLALRTANALLEVTFGGKAELALPKQVQRDPIRGDIEHVDLLLVRRGEKVSVEVPLVVVGTPAPDSLVVVDHQSLVFEASATSIPDEITVSVEGLPVGTQIFAKDLELPADVALDGDPEVMVLSINPTAVQDLGDAADEAAPASE